jgi:hypothetical protein
VTVSVTEDEYFEALGSAMDILSSRLPTSTRPMGEQALGAVLAWVWDGASTKSEMLGGLLCCDLELRDLALTIIAGRCCHGRPVEHPRRDEIEHFFDSFTREKCTGGTD